MADIAQLLAQARAGYAQELQDPTLAARLAGITHAEVGGQGPQAQQAFMETLFNRAAARRQTMAQTLSGSYFPQITYDRAARFGADPRIAGQYAPMVSTVMGGSNVANLATGNASGTVGFAGGPQVAAYNGERFGVEGPDRAWAQRMQGGTPLQAMAATVMPTPSAVPTSGPAPAASPAPFAPPANDLGSLAAAFVQNAATMRKREEEQQAAEQARRAALFGGAPGGRLAGLFG